MRKKYFNKDNFICLNLSLREINEGISICGFHPKQDKL